MKDTIVTISGHLYYKSFIFRGNEFWLSTKKIRSVSTFEKQRENPSLLSSFAYYPSETIKEVQFNESTHVLFLKYENKKGELKKIELTRFGKSAANKYGHFLGTTLSMNKSFAKEDKLKPIPRNLMYIAVPICLTYWIMTGSMPEFTKGGEPSEHSGADDIRRMVLENIGTTGTLALGGILTALAIYKLYRRLVKPANDVIYTREVLKFS